MKKTFQNLIHNKKTKFFLIAGAIIGIFFYCCSVIIGQVADISRLNAQKAEYAQQIEAQKRENEELDAILQSDDKDEYMEQKAREKGYVKSNEIVFYDISGSN